MTGTEWRYLQKIALDHPYYDTHKLPLTEAEARTIAKQNNTLTGEQFVDSVYAKLGMTRPAKEKKRFAWLRGVGALFAVPPIRRIAIAVLAVLLLTVFFAATPAGRAIAESVIEFVTCIYKGEGVVLHRSDSEVTSTVFDRELKNSWKTTREEGTSNIHHVCSFDEFSSITGEKPLVLPLKNSELYYSVDEEGLIFFSIYDDPKGQIVAYQIWNMEEIVAQTSSDFVIFDEDDSICYSIERETGCIDCIKKLKDSVFVIYANGEFTLDDIIQMIKTE